MGQDQRDWSRAMAPLMEKVDADALRRIPIVMERREPLHLRLPVELLSPVAANLLKKTEAEAVFPT
jgi:hypothetical protein